MNVKTIPEFELICLAARPTALRDLEALRKASAQVDDWTAVIEGARRNRVTQPVFDALKQCAAKIQPDILDELKRQTTDSIVRSLAKIPEIEKLAAAFGEADIQFLILKGIPLSLQLYDDATRRPADDIDILVSPGQFWRADAILRQSGYRYDIEPPAAARLGDYTKWVKHVRYINDRSRTVIELHHRLTGNPYLLEWPFEDLWADCDFVRVGNSKIATLSKGGLALYLLAHGANHAWERLRWLVDFATALQGQNDLQRLLDEASPVGLRPALLQALALAHMWLGLPVADLYLAEAEASLKVKWLDFCLARFLGDATWRGRPRANSLEWLWRFSLWFFVYNFSLRSNWRYRAHQFVSLWVYPPDWDSFRLPASLFWLYPVLRPIGWLKRWLGKS